MPSDAALQVAREIWESPWPPGPGEDTLESFVATVAEIIDRHMPKRDSGNDAPKNRVQTNSVEDSEIEPDDRQEQGSGDADRQGREGGEVGGCPSILTGGLQRGERDVRREDSGGNEVDALGGGSTTSPPDLAALLVEAAEVLDYTRHSCPSDLVVRLRKAAEEIR